jgi:hypothetical protein
MQTNRFMQKSGYDNYHRENDENSRNVLCCPCIISLFVRVQPDTLISFYVNYYLQHVSNMFQFLLSHCQGEAYKEIYIYMYMIIHLHLRALYMLLFVRKL